MSTKTQFLSEGALWITSLGLILTVYAVLIPSQYYFTKMYEQTGKTNLVISKRFVNIVKVVNYLAIIGGIIHYPLFIICNISPIKNTHPLLFNSIAAKLYYIFFFIFDGTALFSLCKYWLILYNINYCKSDINKQWKIYLIGPAFESNNFWLKYKQTFGSESFMIKIVIFLWIILYTIQCIDVALIFKEESPIIYLRFLSTSAFVIPAIFCVIMFVKISSIQSLDIFYLKYELKSVVILALLILPISFIFNICKANNLQCNTPFIVGILDAINFFIGVSGYMLLTTYWVLRQHHKYGHDGWNYNKIDYRQTSMYHNQIYSDAQIKTEESDTYQHEYGSLMDILNHNENCEFFIQFLGRNDAVQTILCFIELLQLKNTIRSLYLPSNDVVVADYINDGYEDEDELYDYWQCDMMDNESVPKSSMIVDLEEDLRGTDDEDKERRLILEVMYSLYDKYVNENSDNTELLVELMSNRLRRKYDKRMECDLDEFLRNNEELRTEEMFVYFDDVIFELFISMRNGYYNRFICIDKQQHIGNIMFRNLLFND